MISDFLKNEKANHQPIELSVRRYEKYGDDENVVFLRTRIENNLDEPICIPSSIYDSGATITLDLILNVQTSDGAAVPTKLYTPRINWPTNRYVVIVPGGEDIASINLSKLYEIDEATKAISVSFSFPAFNCSIFADGYPVTEEMFADPGRLLENLGKIAPVDSQKVIVFKGESTLSLK